MVTSAADQNANVIFGAVIDDSGRDEVRVTVIATGFGAHTPPPRRAAARPLASARVPRARLPGELLDVPSFLREP